MKSLLIDIAGIAGAASVAGGAWMIYQPAGIMVAGLLLLAFSITGAKRWA